MGLVELCALCLFVGEEVVPHFLTLSMFTGWLGLPGHWKVLLCRISWGKGMLGPIRVNLKSSRMSSRGFFAVWAVFSTVLMVLTCHSTKPLDLGKQGEDVECSMWLHRRTEQAPQTKKLAIVH